MHMDGTARAPVPVLGLGEKTLGLPWLHPAQHGFCGFQVALLNISLKRPKAELTSEVIL